MIPSAFTVDSPQFSVRGPHGKIPYVAIVTLRDDKADDYQGEFFTKPILLWAKNKDIASRLVNEHTRKLETISIELYEANANHHLGSQAVVSLAYVPPTV